MTDKEKTELIRLLGMCEPGALPEEVFIAFARLTVLPAIEFVPLRYNEGHIEVLLIERPASDPIWPGMLHTPGTVLRSNDKTAQDAFDRLLHEELIVDGKYTMTFNGWSFVHIKRGAGVTLEYIIQLAQQPLHGKYYPYDKLPNNFIEDQQDMVGRAVETFRRSLKK
ncbi:MAG TPA: hypothetical protein VLH84_05275 [Patescibacteria group bacterium]|nr:hypothetical protein [Patescibacteria group bacterium]